MDDTHQSGGYPKASDIALPGVPAGPTKVGYWNILRMTRSS